MKDTRMIHEMKRTNFTPLAWFTLAPSHLLRILEILPHDHTYDGYNVL